jgi:hypothetical protein
MDRTDSTSDGMCRTDPDDVGECCFAPGAEALRRSSFYWGATLLVFPLMLIYTASSYRVFRGKVGVTPAHY